jgi:8-oxo-dGTP diphosphatase
MKSIELIVRIIIKRGSKILLCKSNEEGQGHYFLPGGHVEFGEYFVDTIYRELKEEMGIEKNQISNIKYKDFLENMYGKEDNKSQELNMIFTADIDSNLEIKSQESHINFEWVEIGEIQNVNFLPKTMIPILVVNFV